jgi:hypothetical protein
MYSVLNVTVSTDVFKGVKSVFSFCFHASSMFNQTGLTNLVSTLVEALDTKWVYLKNFNVLYWSKHKVFSVDHMLLHKKDKGSLFTIIFILMGLVLVPCVLCQRGYQTFVLNCGHRCLVVLLQRWPTDGRRAGCRPQLDLLWPLPNHRFSSIGESFNICLILLVQCRI